MTTNQQTALLADKKSSYCACKTMAGNELSETKSNAQIIVVGEETYHIYSYRSTTFRKLLSFFLTILTLGTYQLFAYWIPRIKIYVSLTPCSHAEAETIMIIDQHEIITLKQVTTERYEDGADRPNTDGTHDIVNEVRYFIYRKMRYIWFESFYEWKNPSDIVSEMPFSTFLNRSNDEEGLDTATVSRRARMYGKNAIRVGVPSVFNVLIKEVFSPFYIFQVLSVTLWYSDSYVYYATVIVIISVGTIIFEVRNIRSQYRRIKDMVGGMSMITCIRSGEQREICADQLVPGDIICIPSKITIMPCDCLLLNGTVIVNESMLTGESVPVTKVPVEGADDKGPNVKFSSEAHSRHELYSGTTILQSRYYPGKPVRAVVVRTAYSTLKGSLVRAILYPKPVDSQYTKDIFMFVAFLFMVALTGFIFTVAIMISRKEPFMHIFVRALDLITIVVPPALPAAMSVGIMNAHMRLKNKLIFCISPSTINTCGLIDVCCFDKTGTLTEDGLDFHKFRAVRKFGPKKNTFTEEHDDFDYASMMKDGVGDDIILAAATCQSLTRIDGQIHGDPLDLILFKKSKWSLKEPVKSDHEIELFDMFEPTLLEPPSDGSGTLIGDVSVVRQFTFSSALQRMSVVVSKTSDTSSHAMTVFCKGSPEMVASLCDPSTIPSDYSNIVNYYAHKGYRIIALAYRNLDMNFARAMRLPRVKVESDLELLGIVVMENRLKPATTGVIRELSNADIRTVMVTGDNILTAMSVARECEIIRTNCKSYMIQHTIDKKTNKKPELKLSENVTDKHPIIIESVDQLETLISTDDQLAMTGDTFGVAFDEYPEILDFLITRTDVFARMSPQNKSGLITELQKIGLKTMMCGDGANDCQALKAADAGISLSDAEASIAAPFTSKIADIRCVPEVIKEGRCALVTSFSVFKYMATYSLCEFITVLLLYVNRSNLTDSQFLYIDFILITITALTMGNTAAAQKLTRRKPPARLMSVTSVASIIGVVILLLLVQGFAFVNVTHQSWFIPYVESEDLPSMRGTTLFTVTSFFYLAIAVIYSSGSQYRRPIYTNWLLCATVLIIGSITFVITLPSISWLDKFMGFIELPSLTYRIFIIVVSYAASLVLYLYEHFFVQKFVRYIEGLISSRGTNKIRTVSHAESTEQQEDRYISEPNDGTLVTKL